jgi:predicted metal-binding protein
MDDIHPMFQEGFYQPVNPAPGTAAACEECYHLDILAVIAEMHRASVESFETTHARTCL